MILSIWDNPSGAEASTTPAGKNPGTHRDELNPATDSGSRGSRAEIVAKGPAPDPIR